MEIIIVIISVEDLAAVLKLLLALGIGGAMVMVNTSSFVSCLTYGESFLTYMLHTPLLMVGIIIGLIALGVLLNLLGYNPGFSALLTGMIVALVLLIMLICNCISSGEFAFMGEKGAMTILGYLLGVIFFTIFFTPIVTLSAAISSIPFAFVGYPDRLTQWASFGMYLGAASLGLWLARVNNNSFYQYWEGIGTMHDWIPFDSDSSLGIQLFGANRSIFFYAGIVLVIVCGFIIWVVHNSNETESVFD